MSGKVFKVLVNYNDPTHRKINKEEFDLVDSNIKCKKHLPINGTGERK